MNKKNKALLAATLLFAILLSACDTNSASAQRIQKNGSEDASGVIRTGSQIYENCPTPAVEESGQAVVSAADPELPVSSEHVEGLPSPAERDEILGRVNRSPERPVDGRDVTEPEPGSETNLPSSQDETSPDYLLGDVNKAPEREQGETSTGTDFLTSIIAFLQQLFGSTSVSSASEEVQVERIPCP